MRILLPTLLLFLLVPAAPADPPAPKSAARPATFAIVKATLVNPSTLRVFYGVGSPACTGKLGRIELAETAQRVTITLHRVWPPGSEQPRICPHYRLFRAAEVRLAAPLGNRTVVDGATGKPMAVTHAPPPHD